MKIKYIVLTVIIFFLCGCHLVSNNDIDSLIQKLSSSISEINEYRNGYSYYLPNSMKVREYSPCNEIIDSSNYTYYLYTDLILYYNKTANSYTENPNSYYSKAFSFDNKYGYIEINSMKNNQYLIEIMFNYAKIEVMVDKDDINNALANAITILRSVNYNDVIINNLLGEDVLSYQEEVYDIFSTVSNNSENILSAIDVTDYDSQDNMIKDSDFVD